MIVLVSLAAIDTYRASFDHDVAARDLRNAALLERTVNASLRLLVEEESARRAYFLTGAAAQLRVFQQKHMRRRGAFARLGELLNRRGFHDEWRTLREAVAERDRSVHRTIATPPRRSEPLSPAELAAVDSERVDAELRSLEQRIGRTNDRTAAAMSVRAEANRVRSLVLAATVLLLSIVLGAYAARVVARDLAGIARAAKEAIDNRYRALAESTFDLLAVFLPEGRFHYIGASCERIIGYSPEEILEMDARSLLDEVDRRGIETAVRAVVETGEATRAFQHVVICKDGSRRWLETRFIPLVDEAGTVDRVLATSQDVTDRRLAEIEINQVVDQLADAALRDEPTGLLNRRGMTHHATGLFKHASDAGVPVMMVYCDLNGLKSINDTLGHDAGDAAIADAANLLHSMVRGSDLVARLGGDEFVVLGMINETSGAASFTARLRARAREFNRTSDRPYRLSMSVGVTIWLPDAPKPLAAMLKEADAAMYREKRTRSRANLTPSGEHVVRQGAGDLPS